MNGYGIEFVQHLAVNSVALIDIRRNTVAGKVIFFNSYGMKLNNERKAAFDLRRRIKGKANVSLYSLDWVRWCVVVNVILYGIRCFDEIEMRIISWKKFIAMTVHCFCLDVLLSSSYGLPD